MPAWLTLSAVKRFAPLIGIGLLLLALGYQTLTKRTAIAQRDALSAKLSEVAAEQVRQNERLNQWAKDIERNSKDLANVADTKYQAGVAAGNAAAERYIQSHRVRAPQDRGQSIHPAALASPDSAGLPEGAATDSVVVEADDVRICTALYSYALNAHEWGKSVESGR